MENKYFCRNCKGLRNQTVLKEVKRKGGDDYDNFQWIDKYLIIECNGCETISFLNIYGNTEMYHTHDEGYPDYYEDEFIYPYYLENSSEIEYQHFLPEKIKIIYAETISAFKSNSYILTAGGLRAIIEALCNHLKIRKDNLEERINLLSKKGYLTKSESNRLHSIRFLGNDALHEIEKPKKEHLYLLLDIINHLLMNLFINDKKIKGRVDTLIDDFEDFLILVKNKLKEEMKGKEYTLKEILGKSKRLMHKNKITEFESKLNEEINNGKHSFIEISITKPEMKYKIIEMPYRFSF